MSSTAETIQTNSSARHDSRWSLWLRQVAAIMRLEVEKNFFGKRAVLVYLLAFMPIGLLLLIAIMPPGTREWLDFARYPLLFSIIYNALILRTVVFFGCSWIFMNLFRGDIVDRSLHYYFLAPVRREVLVCGKYLSGLMSSILLFGASTAGSLFFFYYARGYSASAQYIFGGPGLRQIISYMAIA